MKRLASGCAAALAPDPERALVAWLFLKGLALVYVAAFVSLGLQIDGLAGPDGILPFGRLLQQSYEERGAAALWQTPTLFWLGAGSGALRGAAAAGALLALAVLLGLPRGRPMPRTLLALLFVLYLSLYHAGQVFTSFQWDYLLLECGLLAIFLPGGPPRLALWMLEWLLFRLRFCSGLFKLASGDPSWAGFTALDHYFETQPLPHAGSWYAHQLPHAVHAAGVGFTFFAELVVPFFLFGPRTLRRAAAGITVLAQLLILATSNHNFINLLTILLCLFALDDALLRAWLPRALLRLALPAAAGDRAVQAGATPMRRARGVALAGVAGTIALLSLLTFGATLAPGRMPRALFAWADGARILGVGNAFHLFPTMQTERQELVVYGSDDGAHWQAYGFRAKPQALDAAPGWLVPHQPRLDWMMWFVPQQWPQTGYWFDAFLQGLRENRPAVTGLLAANPFEGRAPPRELRVLAFRYEFTTPAERAASGAWWRARLLGEYPDVPPRRP